MSSDIVFGNTATQILADIKLGSLGREICHTLSLRIQKGLGLTTTLLGANGKLGAILACFAKRSGLGWRTQSRTELTDLQWSGAFDDPAADSVFVQGVTLINMIGYTGPDEELLHDINIRFVKDLLVKAADTGVAHVVLASSAAVYGAGDDTPFDENHSLKPITPYGVSKSKMEDIAHRLSATSTSPAITILRIGNIAGADALSAAANCQVRGGTPMPLHRFPDGTAALRSYIGPRDLFDVVCALSEPHNGPLRTINVAQPQPVSLDDMLRAYKTHHIPQLTWVDMPAPDSIPHRVTLSTDKVQSFVNSEEYDEPADAMVQQMVGVTTR